MFSKKIYLLILFSLTLGQICAVIGSHLNDIDALLDDLSIVALSIENAVRVIY